jgi:hypothetical protein
MTLKLASSNRIQTLHNSQVYTEHLLSVSDCSRQQRYRGEPTLMVPVHTAVHQVALSSPSHKVYCREHIPQVFTLRFLLSVMTQPGSQPVTPAIPALSSFYFLTSLDICLPSWAAALAQSPFPHSCLPMGSLTACLTFP